MQKAPQLRRFYTTLDRKAKKGMVKESSSTDDKNRRLFTISGANKSVPTNPWCHAGTGRFPRPGAAGA